MNITRDNYESFFLDFLEGTLEEKHVDQFLDFLEQNPDLNEELQLFENITIPEMIVLFSDKKKLYKSASDEIDLSENILIAHFEGDLDMAEKEKVEAYLADHPELKKEYNLLSKTRLVPEVGVIYPEKQKLYRKSAATIFLNWAGRAAAVLVLIWGINSVFQYTNQQPQIPVQKLAELTPKVTPPIEKNVTEKKNPENEVLPQDKPVQVKESKPPQKKSLREQTKGRLEEKRSVESKPAERNLTAMAEIRPIYSQLESDQVDNRLAFSHANRITNINDPQNIISVEEFLAQQVKKVGDEGLNSAQRIIRAGLGIASEISGERIGYRVKNGKVSSLEFESKLMAFSIPLKKN